jgi:hypothetical protein
MISQGEFVIDHKSTCESSEEIARKRAMIIG